MAIEAQSLSFPATTRPRYLGFVSSQEIWGGYVEWWAVLYVDVIRSYESLPQLRYIFTFVTTLADAFLRGTLRKPCLAARLSLCLFH